MTPLTGDKSNSTDPALRAEITGLRKYQDYHSEFQASEWPTGSAQYVIYDDCVHFHVQLDNYVYVWPAKLLMPRGQHPPKSGPGINSTPGHENQNASILAPYKMHGTFIFYSLYKSSFKSVKTIR